MPTGKERKNRGGKLSRRRLTFVFGIFKRNKGKKRYRHILLGLDSQRKKIKQDKSGSYSQVRRKKWGKEKSVQMESDFSVGESKKRSPKGKNKGVDNLLLRLNSQVRRRKKRKMGRDEE